MHVSIIRRYISLMTVALLFAGCNSNVTNDDEGMNELVEVSGKNMQALEGEGISILEPMPMPVPPSTHRLLLPIAAQQFFYADDGQVVEGQKITFNLEKTKIAASLNEAIQVKVFGTYGNGNRVTLMTSTMSADQGRKQLTLDVPQGDLVWMHIEAKRLDFTQRAPAADLAPHLYSNFKTAAIVGGTGVIGTVSQMAPQQQTGQQQQIMGSSIAPQVLCAALGVRWDNPQVPGQPNLTSMITGQVVAPGVQILSRTPGETTTQIIDPTSLDPCSVSVVFARSGNPYGFTVLRNDGRGAGNYDKLVDLYNVNGSGVNLLQANLIGAAPQTAAIVAIASSVQAATGGATTFLAESDPTKPNMAVEYGVVDANGDQIPEFTYKSAQEGINGSNVFASSYAIVATDFTNVDPYYNTIPDKDVLSIGDINLSLYGLPIQQVGFDANFKDASGVYRRMTRDTFFDENGAAFPNADCFGVGCPTWGGNDQTVRLYGRGVAYSYLKQLVMIVGNDIQGTISGPYTKLMVFKPMVPAQINQFGRRQYQALNATQLQNMFGAGVMGIINNPANTIRDIGVYKNNLKAAVEKRFHHMGVVLPDPSEYVVITFDNRPSLVLAHDYISDTYTPINMGGASLNSTLALSAPTFLYMTSFNPNTWEAPLTVLGFPNNTNLKELMVYNNAQGQMINYSGSQHPTLQNLVLDAITPFTVRDYSTSTTGTYHAAYFTTNSLNSSLTQVFE